MDFSNYNSGNLYYRHGEHVYGPIEVEKNRLVIRIKNLILPFPKNEQGLRQAITDARKTDLPVENGQIVCSLYPGQVIYLN